MLKALINWYSRKVASYAPTALQTMQDSLRDAEMEYLRTVEKQEYHACQAEMQAVAVKHDFKRCQRLQKFIDQETQFIDRHAEEPEKSSDQTPTTQP